MLLHTDGTSSPNCYWSQEGVIPWDAIFKPSVRNLFDKGKCAISGSMIQNASQKNNKYKITPRFGKLKRVLSSRDILSVGGYKKSCFCCKIFSSKMFTNIFKSLTDTAIVVCAVLFLFTWCFVYITHCSVYTCLVHYFICLFFFYQSGPLSKRHLEKAGIKKIFKMNWTLSVWIHHGNWFHSNLPGATWI